MTRLEKKDILGMLAIMKANYSYAYKDLDESGTKTLVNTWFVLLSKYPKEMVQASFYKALETCKMPPTIADIIEKINEMIDATQKSDLELWDEFEKSLRKADAFVSKFTYTMLLSNGLTQGEQARLDTRELYETLPQELREYCPSYAGFMALATNQQSWEFEKPRFLKAITDIKKRLFTQRTMPPEIKQIICESQNLLQIGEEDGQEENI
jgi:hypothetical protein